MLAKFKPHGGGSLIQVDPSLVTSVIECANDDDEENRGPFCIIDHGQFKEEIVAGTAAEVEAILATARRIKLHVEVEGVVLPFYVRPGAIDAVGKVGGKNMVRVATISQEVCESVPDILAQLGWAE